VGFSSERRGTLEFLISFLAFLLLILSLYLPAQSEKLFYLSGASALLGIYGGIQTTKSMPQSKRLLSLSAMTLSISIAGFVFGETFLRFLKAFLFHGLRLLPPPK
jgi:hypothetical protein